MKSVSIIIVSVFILSGCATLIDGYEATIKVSNVTDSTCILDASGKGLDKINRNNNRMRVTNNGLSSAHIVADKVTPGYIQMLRSKYDSLEIVYDVDIKVRRNEDIRLTIHHKGKELVVNQYPKVGLGWFFLDILNCGIGFVLDGYTGNWNVYENIVLE